MAADGDAQCHRRAPPEAEEEEDEPPCLESSYNKFWSSFGLSIKYGILEDYANRKRLMNLLRYKTTHTEGDEVISLDEYVARMREGQSHIYFIAGASVPDLLRSASLERLMALDYEVLLMDSTIDEYVMMHATEYSTDVRNVNTGAPEDEDEEPEDNTYSFKNINADDLVLGKKDTNKDLAKHYRRKFKKFAGWMRGVIRGSAASTAPGTGNGELREVKVSNRLERSPAVVVSGKYGYVARGGMQKGAPPPLRVP